MNTSQEEKRKRIMRFEFLAVGLYLIGLTLILVGPAWLMQKTLSRIAVALLFASPWIYQFVSSIREAISNVKNNAASSICFLIGIVLWVVAMLSRDKGLWILLGAGSFLILGALPLLIPRIKNVPAAVEKKYHSVRESYKEIKEHHSD